LSGSLSLCTVPQIDRGLKKALVNRGCVVVDLTSLRLNWKPGVAVFATVLDWAGGWPAAGMVLFGADRELAAALDRSQVTQTLPLVADLPAALQRVHGRPARVRRCQDLLPEATAPRSARALVRQACRDWDIPIQTESAAALVVSELALNAAVHAATPLRVRVELTDQALSISVRDLRPDLPLRLIPRSRAPRLLGLHVVSALASDWGVTGHPDAKIAWAQFPLSAAATAAPAGRWPAQYAPPPDHPDR
jgi:hypothetical protein